MLHLQAHAAGSAARRHTNQDPWVSLANSGRLTPLSSPASGLLASGGGAFGLHTNSPLSSMMVPQDGQSDTPYTPWESKKRFWVAAGEVGILLFIPWAMARWVRTWEDPADNWAKVTPDTWWNNISMGWEYDGDNFLTNAFSHPYHGALFFNAARTNGYNFWESVPFALSGSMIWEYFGETFRPAFNDWIATGVTGINFGESLYRLSAMVTDNTATGSESVWREIGGALVNPVRGFNRLISGETGRVFANPEEHSPKYFDNVFRFGARTMDTDGNIDAKDAITQGYVSMDLIYGNPFDSDLSTPFSTFQFGGAITLFNRQRDSLQVLNRIQSKGHLWGFKLQDDRDTKHIMDLIISYDYINNPAFEFGNTSIAARWLAMYRYGEESAFIPDVELHGILMGATPNDYFVDPEGRNYDFGPGVAIRASGRIRSAGWTVGSLRYVSGWIWTMSPVDGHPFNSWHHFHFLSVAGAYPFSSKWAIEGSLGWYWRDSHYPAPYQDVHAVNPIALLVLQYNP
ncbi:MAG: DUF3943 domain-containing protein [Bacteroidota bacterium]